MPCSSTGLPVAMVVHTSGESSGSSERSSPDAPRWRSAAKFGSLPAASSGRIISQSAPSQPTRRTLRPVGRASRVTPVFTTAAATGLRSAGARTASASAVAPLSASALPARRSSRSAPPVPKISAGSRARAGRARASPLSTASRPSTNGRHPAASIHSRSRPAATASRPWTVSTRAAPSAVRTVTSRSTGSGAVGSRNSSLAHGRRQCQPGPTTRGAAPADRRTRPTSPPRTWNMPATTATATISATVTGRAIRQSRFFLAITGAA